MPWYTGSLNTLYKELDSSKAGLTKNEALVRLQKYGENQLVFKTKPLWKILLEPFANIFVIVLLLAVTISLLSGETLDASIIGLIICINAVIFYTQQFTTSRVMRSLKNYSLQNVKVYRNGTLTEIISTQLVPGDVMQLQEGEKIPADARLISVESFEVNESSLTGESIPVFKKPHDLEINKELYEQSNMVFQGTYVVAGLANAIVVATANETEFSKIAALSTTEKSKSPVEIKIDKIIVSIIKIVAIVAVVVFILALLRGIPAGESLRYALSLTVSAVPEGLPVALSVILVLGMRRMARKKALVRDFQSIENIGLVTTIATDKTGTLTKNHLSIVDYWSYSPSISLKEFARKTIAQSNVHPDPLDKAIYESMKSDEVVTKYYPFDLRIRMSGAFIEKEQYIYIKGAPEHILKISDNSSTVSKKAESAMHERTSKGYRVIAIARFKTQKALSNLGNLPVKGIEFLGFISLADELRPEAKPAVQAAHDAGIAVCLVTGDHYETAFNIAKKVGIATHPNQVTAGVDLPKDDNAILTAIQGKAVFSRILPKNKYRILQALKKNNITAMTGDGVNDVPAISSAHVGISMGSGSDIARDASGIVLLNDNFSTIVDAIAESRKIFDNISKMLFYLLSTSLGEILTMIGALIIGLPLPVTAIQILWINLVTDTAMVIPLGLEPEEKNIMSRPPRDPKAPILNSFLLSRMVIIGSTMAIITLIVVFILDRQGYSSEYIQTVAFMTLVVAQWMNAFNARSESTSSFTRVKVFNPGMLIGLLVGFSLQMAVLFGPLQNIFSIQNVSIGLLLTTSAIMAVTILTAAEIHKMIVRRKAVI